VRRHTARQRFSSSEGLTLVELMVAMLVLGVIFSALGGVIITSLRAITTSEREVRATALAQQVIEEFQAVAWDAAGLYSNEVAAAPAEWNGGNTTTYDGEELVLLAAPASGARLAQVPQPRDEFPIGNVDYTVDRYVAWVDSDGDGTPETKRFTALVTWNSLNGDERSITSVGDRVPTQAESPATSVGARVLAVTGTPDPSEIDFDTARNANDITVTVRLNQGVLPSPAPTLSFYTLGEPPAAGDAEEYVLRTLSMTGSESGDNGYPTLWRRAIPANTYRFVNGPLDVLFAAKDNGSNLIEAFGSVQLRGGPLTGPGPRPPSESETAEAFPSPPTTGDPEGGIGPEAVRIQAVQVTNSPICVEKSTWRLKKPVELSINVKGLVAADGNVTVSYLTWTETKPNQTKLVTDTAMFNSGNLSSSNYRHTIAQSAERLFRPGQTITFTAQGSRADGSNHLLDSAGVTVSDSC
jgi:prepilin-type N-terminal cleavage/methylation domain-containing protein